MKYEVQMLVDDVWYPYGTWADRNTANEVAMQIRAERNVETFIEEI
jgi:hypothetical protein